MFQFGPIGHRVGSLIRRLWVAIRSHPFILTFLVSAILLWVFRNYLWIHVPISVHQISHPIFVFAQTHPIFGRVLHVAFNAIPDVAFALLAIAGLAYLVPKSWIDRLEDLIWVRILLIVLFGTFGFAAIIVNAINREEEDHAKKELRDTIEDQSNKLKGISGTNGKILEYFVSTKSPMSEPERRENIEKTLRNEFILSHDPIDPEILAGNKMPPDEWMNRRLKALGELWTVKNEPHRLPAQVVQAAPEEKKAVVEFSFYKNNMSGPPDTLVINPMADDKVSVSIGAIVRGDTPAENLQVWLRICEKCQWLSPDPVGFLSTSPDAPYDRGAFIQELQPNVLSQKWNVVFQIPRYPHFESAPIACYFACKNCPTVDWNKPQVLWISRSMGAAAKLQFPSILYTPEPVKK